MVIAREKVDKARPDLHPGGPVAHEDGDRREGEADRRAEAKDDLANIEFHRFTHCASVSSVCCLLNSERQCRPPSSLRNSVPDKPAAIPKRGENADAAIASATPLGTGVTSPFVMRIANPCSPAA